MNLSLSIISISLHNTKLFATLNSVAIQKLSHHRFEHIIIEGDKTLLDNQKIKRYQRCSPYQVTYICEPDSGRYSAMNKGILRARGEYLLFLNAGDTLANSQVLKKTFETKHSTDILYGDSLYTDETSPHSLAHSKIDANFFIFRNLFHQSTFIKKKLFNKFGLYDEHYSIVADYEFWLRTIMKNKSSVSYLPFVISRYDTHGISSTQINQLYAERALAISRYYSGYSAIYHRLKYYYYLIRLKLHVGK